MFINFPLLLQVVSQLFQQRIVRLGGAVDDEPANLIVAQLLYLDSVSPNSDITLYINVSLFLLSFTSLGLELSII